MEITKKDRKHIEDCVRKVELRVDIEASEYARLYKIEYLIRLRDQIDAKLEALNYIADRTIEMCNTPTD